MTIPSLPSPEREPSYRHSSQAMSRDWVAFAVERVLSCCRLPRLDPTQVGEVFERRARLEEEDDIQTCYQLIGGPLFPLGRGELRWIRKRSKGVVLLDLAEEAHVPLATWVEAVGRETPCAFLRHDPQDLDSTLVLAYPVPVGELQLLFRGPGEKAEVSSCVVSEFPEVVWDTRRDNKKTLTG